MIRALLTYDASLQGTGRFSVSAADLTCREEWARLSTADATLTGSQIISTVLLSHASAFPTRTMLLDSNKKLAPPISAVSKFPSAPSSADGERKRDRTDGLFKNPWFGPISFSFSRRFGSFVRISFLFWCPCG